MTNEPAVICPYCGQPAKWVSNAVIYGKPYGSSYMIWWCQSCDAYVGCHNNTKKPKGTLANGVLREWRIKAHNAVDPLWRELKIMGRQEMYARMQDDFNLDTPVHIGESDIEMCKKIIHWARKQ